ncbi:MAG: hypothetical protein D6785_03400 [Planctomycetota bacterium]|nr:MAG: hypothetical protein D6785_03400 [Planctomycetota bacterium]
MKKGLFYLMVLVFVFLGNPILRGEQDCEEGQKCSKKKVRKIKKEINLLNLMNGLNLSADQIKELLKLAKDLKALGEEMGILKKKEISKEAQNKKLQLLKEIQERILQGQEIPIRLRKELISLQRQTNPYPTREEKRKFLKYIKEMEEKASKILTKSQKEVLATYKPCLIPPKNLKDPVRIGQAEVDGKYYKILKKLRKLPNWKYDFLEEAILDELIEKYEFHHGKYEKKERKKIFSKLQEIALKTRKLTDVQFEIQKSKLEKEIKQVL